MVVTDFGFPICMGREMASANLFSLLFLYFMSRSNLVSWSLHRVSRVDGSVIFINQCKDE